MHVLNMYYEVFNFSHSFLTKIPLKLIIKIINNLLTPKL